MIKYLLLHKFKNYTRSINIQLLRDDFLFIDRVLGKFPENYQRAALRKYCMVWQEGMTDEPVDFRKQNKGRYRANCFLREFIKNI
jgi:hypothetical protein